MPEKNTTKTVTIYVCPKCGNYTNIDEYCEEVTFRLGYDPEKQRYTVEDYDIAGMCTIYCPHCDVEMIEIKVPADIASNEEKLRQYIEKHVKPKLAKAQAEI